MKIETQHFSHVNEDMPERNVCVISSIGEANASGIPATVYLDIPRTAFTMNEAKELHRLLGQAIQYNDHRIDTLIREKCSKVG